MAVPEYEYAVEDCDVPVVGHAALNQYRLFRRKCLDYLRGDADTSVVNQLYDLTWHTAVFRTLNEARRLEADRRINGPLWELTTAGYASLMTLGIRKLVDKDSRTDSVWNVLAEAERRPELLTREMFICYDGLPYDYEKVQREELRALSIRSTKPRWLPTKGPRAWTTSEMMHEAFDKLCGNPRERKRNDKIQPSILAGLKERLSHPAIRKVCTLADRRMAHAERASKQSRAVPTVTYNDVDEALRQIVGIVNVLSSQVFYDTAFGSVVATPQFDPLEALDESWVVRENLPTLRRYWDEVCGAMDHWADVDINEFI